MWTTKKVGREGENRKGREQGRMQEFSKGGSPQGMGAGGGCAPSRAKRGSF